MAQVSERDLQVLANITEVAAFAADPNAFGIAVLGQMRRLIACDTVAYNELDMASGVVRFASDPADAVRRADHASFQRLIDQHPVVAYHSRTGDASTLKLSDFVPQSALQSLEIYHDFFRPLEIEHQITVTLLPLRSLLIGFSLQRQRRDFDESDRALLNLARPQLAIGYQQAQARATAARLLEGSLAAPAGEHFDLMLITRGGKVATLAPGAARRLARHFDNRPSPLLPAPLSEWMRQRQRLCHGGAAGALCEPLVVERGRGRLTLNFLRGREPSDLDMVLIHEHAPSQLDGTLRSIAGLSPREGEVIARVGHGMSNAQIATDLMLSERTIHKHLQHIYAKLNVGSRTAALAKLREGDGAPG